MKHLHNETLSQTYKTFCFCSHSMMQSEYYGRSHYTGACKQSPIMIVVSAMTFLHLLIMHAELKYYISCKYAYTPDKIYYAHCCMTASWNALAQLLPTLPEPAAWTEPCTGSIACHADELEAALSACMLAILVLNLFICGCKRLAKVRRLHKCLL